MVSITLAVPEEMKIEMDKHPEMNWLEITMYVVFCYLVGIIFMHQDSF